MVKKWLPYIVIILLLGLIVWQFLSPRTVEKVRTVTRIDTVIVTDYKSDTIYYTKYKDRFLTDTVYAKAIPGKEEKDTATIYHYTDSVVDINLQAKRLDWLQYNIHRKDTITYYQERIQYVPQRDRTPRLYYGVGLGVGYGFFSKQMDVYAGFNVGLRF